MKKNRLGITSENVEAICVNTNAGFFYKVVGIGEIVCNVTTRNTERSDKNATLISDAFNTANRCGLLPSELLEQRDELLDKLRRVLISVESISKYDFDVQTSNELIDECNNTINQIEQQTKTNE